MNNLKRENTKFYSTRPFKIVVSLILALIFVFFLWNYAESWMIFNSRNAEGHAQIDGALSDLLREYQRGGMAAAQEFARDYDIIMDEKGMVTVFLIPKAGRNAKDSIDVEALRSFGGEVIRSSDYLIKAKVPVHMLERIADNVDGISLIQRPDKFSY